jgi:hypothetical protein
MPPRKSNISTTSVPADEGSSAIRPEKERDSINIEDLSLPRTVITRLAKGVLPSNTQIQKDAITGFTKAATVFVNYLSHKYIFLFLFFVLPEGSLVRGSCNRCADVFGRALKWIR